MSLASPLLLIAGLLVAAGLAVAVVLLDRRRTAALAAVGLTENAGRFRLLRVWCSIAGLAMLAIAVAEPSASIPVPRTAGTVIVAVDTSNSMSADDAEPTRLAAAQQAARAFIEAQPASVDIGVVAFQQGALTTAKPSADHGVALAAVDRLRPAGGTSLGSAILTALAAITGRTVTLDEDGAGPALGYWGSATIVLFSDGEDEGQGADVAAAAAVAQSAGVHVETVGVGTAAGTTIEVDGFRLHTALDEDTLRGIAQTTGGSYHAASGVEELDRLASTIDLRLEIADRQEPLAGAFIAIALAFLSAGAALTIVRTGRLV